MQAKNAIKHTATAADSIGLAEDVNRADLVALHNLGPAWAFLDFGQAADADSFPIPPGSRQAFFSPLAWHFVTNGGNADLRILIGAGAEGWDSQGTGEPTGAVGDPVQVETQQPAGNLADPVHVTESVVVLGASAATKPAEIAGTGATAVALAANAARTHAVVKCIPGATATPVWLGLGAAAEANKGLRLDPGDSLQLDADWMFLGAINFYGAVTATVAVWEA